ncbi:GNAT family N-acetyltransferase [Aliivibrio fischeri]|uniref:GNAT family N-acetyltransferase n=1 Tax=Aliivibrio fischeri TaxID=668 RepID=A0A844P0W6_ALIFS|nr:GNAT family N-acetyltransferase [Aliivibrio fischeri]MUK49021.1 GNAT family N-acetyltransferase [Aliivibrio fischeri]
MRLKGQFCTLRLVEIEDASFILKLRTDQKKSKFLSKTNVDLEEQISWIKLYKKREDLKKEYYFIIEDKFNNKVGTYRLYDINHEQATPGSWIIIDGVELSVTIESVLLMYDFVFNRLNLKRINFDVMKGNKRVVRFHESYGSVCIYEDEDNKNYEFDSKQFPEMKTKMRKYIGASHA